MKAKQQDLVWLTELTLVGTPTEVQILTSLAANSGRLVHTIGPHPAGPHDHRIKVRLLLNPTP